MEKVKTETVAKAIGRSHDGRTNVWTVECPKCGNKFSPQTTLRSKQEIDCPKPKCGAFMLADYNAEPPTVKLVVIK